MKPNITFVCVESVDYFCDSFKLSCNAIDFTNYLLHVLFSHPWHIVTILCNISYERLPFAYVTILHVFRN